MDSRRKRGPIPFHTWVDRVAWALKHIDDPVSLAESPLAELPAARAVGQRIYQSSLIAEGYALQELLQVSADWVIADLEGSGKSQRAAQFLALYIQNPSVTETAKRLGRSREHVSRSYRTMAFALVTKAFLRLAQDHTGESLEHTPSRCRHRSSIR